MQYLFRGVPPLTMPPLPILEIRDGSSRSVSDLLAKEVCADTLQTAGVSSTGHLHVSEAPPPMVVSHHHSHTQTLSWIGLIARMRTSG